MNEPVTYGDFTDVAAHYRHKFHYTASVLDLLCAHVDVGRPGFAVVDVGAGAGELTAALAEKGCRGFAIEPNAAMSAEGKARMGAASCFEWAHGTAEAIPLEDASVDWVCYGGSFHWAQKAAALSEARRVLRPGGFLTAIWTLRDLDHDRLHVAVDEKIEEMIPNVHRVHHGIRSLMNRIVDVLQSSGEFGDCVQIGGWHCEVTPKERYLDMWRMAHDVRSQASPERFEEILAAIDELIGARTTLDLHYDTRSWTVRML